MEKYKSLSKCLLSLLSIIFYFSLAPNIYAHVKPLFILQDEHKNTIPTILIINDTMQIYGEVSSEVGRTECKIDDVPYGLSYSHPATFEIKASDFDTMYHTLRFVMYDTKDQLIGKQEYLLKVIQDKALPKRAPRKDKAFSLGKNPKYKKNYIPILMYHDIVTEVTSPSGQVSTTQFKHQIQALLDAGYTPINFIDYQAYKKGSKGLPNKPILITFDDGYKSNYTNAYPILRDKNIEATYFIITDVVGKQTLANDHFTWEEAKEMEESGLIDIQSHTHTHPNMSILDNDELLIQITRSFELIENHLGPRDIKILCYPEFKHSEASHKKSHELGVNFQIIDLASNEKSSKHPSQLRRIHVHNNLTGEDLIKQIAYLTM